MGPSFHSPEPVAITEVAVTQDAHELVLLWREEAARMLARLAWTGSALTTHHFKGGVSLLLSAPIDVLMVATDLNEWAVASAIERLAGREPLPLEPRGAELQVMVAQQSNPRLLALAREAAEHDLPFLWDDDIVSIGLGVHSQSWPLGALPETVAWSKLGRIPVALITGTNGKTTCARLVARMAKEAGFVVGMTSTDGVSVAGSMVAEGDWAGPAGARLVLRDPRVTFAVLETARGGILRRGLALGEVDAALLTNISADHFGAYGIDDSAAMVRAKSVIGHAVRATGRVVVNGDDPALAELRFAAPTVLFSRHESAAVIEAHRAGGGTAWLQRGDTLLLAQGAQTEVLLALRDTPITFGGHAVYNVENALGASATAYALGLPLTAIRAGLRGFAAQDNPGRAELFQVGSVTVMADFGHNPNAIKGVLALVAAMRRASPQTGRLTVITGGAGDRSNADLQAAAEAVFEARPARVFIRDLEGYLRGRAPGEVPSVLREALLGVGMHAGHVQISASEAQAVQAALADAEADEFIVILIHLERDAVRAVIEQAIEQSMAQAAPVERAR